MTTATPPQRQIADGPQRPQVELRVSSYDRVASLLVALLVLVGFFVLIMFIIWLTSRLLMTQQSVPVTLVEEYAGRGDHAEGYEQELEEPGLEELEELEEPQLEAMLEAVTDVVSTQEAALDALETDATATGKGQGSGDQRQSGPGGDGTDDIIPRWERWQIRFTTSGLDAYAEQLNFFRIELGAAGGGSPQVEYAFNLTKPTPDRRSGPGDEESRLYMTWRSGKLAEFDRTLLSRAGINAQGRLTLQFYPPDVENALAQLEAQNAGGRPVQEFEQTIFGVRGSGGRYEFYVEEQTFRSAPG